MTCHGTTYQPSFHSGSRNPRPAARNLFHCTAVDRVANGIELHVRNEELADAAQLASLADETPEGRSIVILAKEKYGMNAGFIAAILLGCVALIPSNVKLQETLRRSFELRIICGDLM